MSLVDIYYSPEKFDLEVVGEIDFSSGSYEFDLTVVWRDTETGALYYADDSGCSCPSPFEYQGRDSLTRVTRTQDLIDHFEDRKRDSYDYDPSDEYSAASRIDAEVGALILKATATS